MERRSLRTSDASSRYLSLGLPRIFFFWRASEKARSGCLSARAACEALPTPAICLLLLPSRQAGQGFQKPAASFYGLDHRPIRRPLTATSSRHVSSLRTRLLWPDRPRGVPRLAYGGLLGRASFLIQANHPANFSRGCVKIACEQSRPINRLRQWLTIMKKLLLNQLRCQRAQHRNSIAAATSPLRMGAA